MYFSSKNNSNPGTCTIQCGTSCDGNGHHMIVCGENPDVRN